VRRKRYECVQKKERNLTRSQWEPVRPNDTRQTHIQVGSRKIQKHALKFYEMGNGAGDASASSKSFAEQASDQAGKDFNQMKRSAMRAMESPFRS
jgi:hypothetical protein